PTLPTMARSTCLSLVAVAMAVAAALAAAGEASSGIGFDLHHRSSPVVRRWAEARGHPGAAWWAEAEGTPEYYAALSRHDRAHLARRGLAEEGDGKKGLLTFASGNLTFRLDGSLHYAEVAVGTPNATFLVALDTGSDLFWVPCDCKQCAPIANASELRGGPELRPYSPGKSSTSKAVTCEHALCERPNACAAAGNSSSSCPYSVRYVSANTSSSGVLVEDVLHLSRQTGGLSTAVKAPVVLGCGQVQTGAFLDGAAVDGLLGLGMDKVSVPSVLHAAGLVASDSFSMCFSPDGLGRINFGDAGRPGQAETPFTIRNTHPTYNISVTAMTVEGKELAAEFAAVVDSGTSFTYLNDPAYTELATSFDSQVREKRANLSASIPFQYCYQLARGQTELFVPEVSLTTRGGAVFPVTRPFVLIAGETSDGQMVAVGYCLAVLQNDIAIDIIGRTRILIHTATVFSSANSSIVPLLIADYFITDEMHAENFMTGLKVVFDRERSVLGWHQFDCYKDVETEAHGGSPGAAPGPSPTTRIKPRQSVPYPGAVPVTPRQPGSGGSRLSFFSMSLLLPLLAAAAAMV
uniref:Peptidase A1 domain-containing protein n=2 Tax=Aegilops tauschii subsp. strangulata TaxID=200361 RepID=A0A453T9B0_AEGTS